ncbi:hypothetical protein KBD49_06760 [Myxococcota bacterium]|nr:hypothetical protein [Myxococcota bacterium]
MRRILAGMAALAAVAGLVACDGGGDTKCSVSEDCAKGLVCQSQKCVERLCNGIADCNGNDICVDGTLVGKDPNFRYCTARQCTEEGAACAEAGTICQGGLCVPGTPVNDVIETDTPVEDTARPDVVEDTGTDTFVPPVTRGDCKPCTGDGDCGENAKCLPVGATKHCLATCQTDGDCPASYICYASSTATKNCLPVSYNCVACAYEGCATEGQTCDFVSGNCKDAKGLCDKCTYDFDCGKGFRCFKTAGTATGACVPECSASAGCTDATNFTCGATEKGVMLCQPKVSDQCGGCPKETPFPAGDGQTCYQCLNNSHCDVAKKEVCDTGSHTCVSQGVDCGTGLIKCNDGSCKQCCQDSDCANNTGPCTDGRCANGVDECQNQCVDPYPVCAVINNIPQCVQCMVDNDCAAIDPACKCTGQPTYACLNDNGSVCSGPMCSATCTSDADCPPGANGETLLCSRPGGGFCYDPSGKCDNMTACCSAGQECFDVLSILFGGIGGGMPGMPGGGLPSTGMAVCSCDDQHPCLGGKACTGTSAICAIPILSDMICPGGQPPSNMPAKLCFDIMDLLGGLFGGGGLP